jgi:O-antigen/teichoic acid export membrane protein
MFQCVRRGRRKVAVSVKIFPSHLPSFVRRVGSLSLGTLVGTGLLFLVSPFLTRLYTPADFGEFNALFGVSLLIGTVASWSFPVSIPLAQTDQDANDLLWLTILFGLGLVPPLTWFASKFVDVNTEGSHVSELWVLAGFAALALIVWTAVRSLASRYSKFGAISVSGVVDAASQSGGQFFLGHAVGGPASLSFGYLLGKITATFLIISSLRSELRRPRHPFRLARVWARQSSLLTPAVLMNQISITALGPIIALLFGVTLAGQFALASRMLAVPSALIGQAVADVFFSKVASMKREERSTTEAVSLVASSLTLLTGPIFTLPLLLGPEIFSLVFGNGWRSAGTAAMLLSPWLALNLVSSPVSGVITVGRRNGVLLGVAFIETILRLSALSLGHSLGSWHFALIAYSVVGCAVSLLAIIWSLTLSGVAVRSWLRATLQQNVTYWIAVILTLSTKPFLPTSAYISLICLVLGFGVWNCVHYLSHLVRSP